MGWPGYRVYRMEIDERGKKLKLWVRRKKAELKLICSHCGKHVAARTIHEVCEREVRDLPCFEYTTTVVVETYRVRCPRCGIRAEKVAQLPSKAPFSKRFEDAVGLACESARKKPWRSSLSSTSAPSSGKGLRPPVWICGNLTGAASTSGYHSAGSCTTSSTFCNMPMRR